MHESEEKKTNDCLTKMLLSLNNIAHHIKHSESPHLANSSSYGALDLSNDEAQHPSQVLLIDFIVNVNLIAKDTFVNIILRHTSV